MVSGLTIAGEVSPIANQLANDAPIRIAHRLRHKTLTTHFAATHLRGIMRAILQLFLGLARMTIDSGTINRGRLNNNYDNQVSGI